MTNLKDKKNNYFTVIGDQKGKSDANLYAVFYLQNDLLLIRQQNCTDPIPSKVLTHNEVPGIGGIYLITEVQMGTN
jgi:hypothetical protein